MATKTKTAPDKEQIREVLLGLEKTLREKGITSLALFGSVLHGDARPDSDVDLLVELDPEAKIGLFDFMDLQEFLEEKIHHPADLIIRKNLHRRIRDRVFAEAEAIF